jgi:hypothetical protein
MKQKLLIKLSELISKYEYLLLGILVLSLLIYQHLNIDFKSSLLILVTSILAVGYFLCAYGNVHHAQAIDETDLDKKWHFLVPFSKKLIAISSSVSCLGILFKSLHWPGAINQFIVGASTLSICTILIIYLRSKNEELIAQSLLVRVIALILIMIYVWYFANN